MSNSVNLALDVAKTGIQNPLIKVRQGDGGFETLRTTVTANGEPMDLQGWTITFMGTTAGNHKIVDGNVKLVEAPNGIFDYTPSKAWGMDIGEFEIAYFKFVNGNGSASSANFRVNVIEAVDLTQAEAQNYISVVDTTIATINKQLNDSLANVTQSIADANKNANTVSSNVNDLGKRVDNYNNKLAAIKVGGRNLMLGTSDWSGGSSRWNYLATVIAETYRGALISSSSSAWGRPRYMLQNAGILQVGKTYTFSTYVRNTSDTDANIASNYDANIVTPDGYTITLPAHTDWTRVSTTFTVQNNPNTSASGLRWETRNNVTNGQVQFAGYKLEEGNLATDWSPAPEDAPSNDAQLVHKTGTETIAGDKTFTSPINGQLSGNAATATKWQTARTLALTGDVTGSVAMDGSGNVSMATNGANLVHKTGNESIAGNKTFTNDVNVGGTLNSSKQYLEIGSRVKSADKSGVTSMWFGWQVYWTIRNGYATYQIRPTSSGTITPNSKSAEKLPVEACPLYKVFVPLRWGGQGFSINTDGTFENDTGVNIDPNASWSTAVSATAQGW